MRRARGTRIAPRRTGPWTAPEILRLRDLLGTAPLDSIARALGRDPSAVGAKVESFGLPRRRGPWRPEEDRLLKRLYGTREDDGLALLLARGVDAVRGRAAVLRLRKDKGFLRRRFGPNASRMPRWSPEEEETLRTLYPRRSNLDIARVLERSVKSVVSKAHDLELRKSPRRLAEMGRTNVSIRYGRVLLPRGSAR